jgi:chromosome segregation protein
MQLKRLEIAGFKSFMERTCLTFEPGVTAVVGPNGCGKSNIVDAVRWAMGEQSAKALRGREMEDVIFNGSDVHHPLGMAEVILTFENNNGHAPPHLADCSEIEVSRRLFRSGESEYAINRVPCRRRDVWELFMDTGLGNRSYGIVEQERVSRIINAKPEERRVVIEEVAGISKYKSRREAAQRKMEATQQNLLRLQDIRREVGQQIQSLERQAKKAERYRRLRSEILDLERRIVLRRWKDLNGEREGMARVGGDLEGRRDRSLTALQTQEASLARERLAMVEQERRLSEAQEALYRQEAQVKALETRLQSHAQELQRLETLEGLLERESALLGQRTAAARDEAARMTGERQSLDEARWGAEARLREIRSALDGLVGERDRLAASLEEDRGLLVELLSERAALRNSVHHRQRQVEEIQRFLERHTGERAELGARLEALRREIGSIEARMQESAGRLEELGARRAFVLDELARLSQRRDGSASALEAVREELHGARSRLSSLQELQDSLEGFADGVRRFRAAHARGEVLRGKPIRLLAEVMEVVEEAEPMVAGALGDRLQYFVVDELGDAVEALPQIREKALGRVGFVALGPGGGAGGPQPPPGIEGDAGAGGGQMVHWEAGYESLGATLLGGVEWVDDARQAMDVWRRNGRHLVVTSEGDVFHPPGIVEGGARRDASQGYLKRKREIRELERRVEALAASEEEGLRGRRALDDAMGALAQEGDRIQSDMRQTEALVSEAQRDLSVAREALRTGEQRLEVLGWEATERSEELVRLGEALGRDSSRLQEVASQIEAAERAIQEKEAGRRGRQQALEDLRGEVTEAQVRLAAVTERCESLDREVERLRAREQELAEERQRKEHQREEGRVRAAELQEQAGCLKGELQGALEGHGRFQEQAHAIRLELDAARARLLDLERASQEERKEARELEQALQGHLLRQQELALRMEHHEGELRGRLAMEADEIPRAAEELPAGDAVQEEAEVAALQASLEGLGEVNLAATEQYEELRVRHEFLTAQQEDLEESIRDLHKAIQKINRTSRKRFREAFEALDAQFRQVFPVLFGGGEAQLILTEAPDVLEAGLEIVARPPGKRLQSISLLSGGEKALTAVALIFAMIMIKPAPFCLFDEVDAPLDDANIDRFTAMVRELSKRSQFILVTHSKRTMEMADALYGVTMERPGVSKMMSVKLQ